MRYESKEITGGTVGRSAGTVGRPGGTVGRPGGHWAAWGSGTASGRPVDGTASGRGVGRPGSRLRHHSVDAVDNQRVVVGGRERGERLIREGAVGLCSSAGACGECGCRSRKERSLAVCQMSYRAEVENRRGCGALMLEPGRHQLPRLGGIAGLCHYSGFHFSVARQARELIRIYEALEIWNGPTNEKRSFLQA